MKDFSILYIGTIGMLLMAVSIVFFVVWATGTLRRQRKYLEQRDKHYLKRIEVVENLVKTEFKTVIEHIKNLQL